MSHGARIIPDRMVPPALYVCSMIHISRGRIRAAAVAAGALAIWLIVLGLFAGAQHRQQSRNEALCRAVDDGNAAAVVLELRNGASIDGFNADGETPLIVAARRRRPDLVRLLLRHGANPNIATEVPFPTAPGRPAWRSRLPLGWAIANADSESVRVLLRHGADASGRRAPVRGLLVNIAPDWTPLELVDLELADRPEGRRIRSMLEKAQHRG